VASNLTAGLPRKRKYREGHLFDEKLDPVTPEQFIEEMEVLAEAESPMEKPKSTNLTILRYMGVGISVFAAWSTGWNSFEWFQNLRPVFVALPMAITMVGASVMLPDFGIILVMQGKRFIGSLIFLSGVLATLFCMVTTVAALYNSHTWRISDVDSTSGTAIRAGQTLSDRSADRERLRKDIDRYAALIEATQAKVADIPAEQTLGAVAQTLQQRLLDYQSTKHGYERDLDAVNREIATAREQAQVTLPRNDFYGFLANIFKGDPATIEFLTATIPAVFLEIVAPVMVAVVMFL
jgi:hypothetical protein